MVVASYLWLVVMVSGIDVVLKRATSWPDSVWAAAAFTLFVIAPLAAGAAYAIMWIGGVL